MKGRAKWNWNRIRNFTAIPAQGFPTVATERNYRNTLNFMRACVVFDRSAVGN
jgi:hypothetical protein